MGLKQKIVSELRLFFIYAAFLTLFFCSLTTYRRLILSEYSISYLHYGSGVIQALIISKIILLGETFQLGEKYASKPLIVPTIYKSVIFSVLVLVFTVVEHFVIGSLHGVPPAHVYEELMNKNIDEILAKILVVFSVFIVFFAFLETGRVFGEDKLMKLFMHKNKKSD